MRKAILAACIAVLALSGLTACGKEHSDTAKFKAALESDFSANPVCLHLGGFPAEVDRQIASGALVNALVGAGYMSREASGANYVLELSETGWSANVFDPVGGKLCYGRKQLVEIDQDDIAEVTKGHLAIVGHRWRLVDMPAWAKGMALDGTAQPVKARAELEIDVTGAWKVKEPLGTAQVRLP